MKRDSFVLDKKVLLPRMARFGRCIHPEVSAWRNLKACVSENSPIDWIKLAHRFRLAEMIGPSSLHPASRAEHMHLKRLYAFFQMGYIVTQDDRLGLFSRVKHNISIGFSPLISTATTGLCDHAAIENKLRGQVDPTVQIVKIEPFAVAFTELDSDGTQGAPAYFWLLHRLTIDRALPQHKSPAPDHDSFVGMKNISKLRRGQVQVCEKPVIIARQMDNLLLEFLASKNIVSHTNNSAVRQLSKDEITQIPAVTFRVGPEYLRRRLELLNILRTVGPSIGVAAYMIDWGQRSSWMHDNWGNIESLLESLKTIAASYFYK